MDLLPKKGWYTSEFWVALGPIIIFILAAVGVDIPVDDVNNIMVAVGGAVAAAYVLARTLLKIFRLKELAGPTLDKGGDLGADLTANENLAGREELVK